MSKLSTYAMGSQNQSYGLDRISNDLHTYRSDRQSHPSTDIRSGASSLDRVHSFNGELHRPAEPTSASYDHSRRPDFRHSISTNQLPPLSSIFAEPTSDVPRPTSYLHRAPTFPSTSQTSGSSLNHGYNNRASWDQSNMSHRASFPYAQDLRQLPSPQTEVPPPLVTSRNSASLDMHHSGPSPTSTHRVPLPSVTWSPRRDQTTHDYVHQSRNDTSSFRPQLEASQHSRTADYQEGRSIGSHHRTTSLETVSNILPQNKGVGLESTAKDTLGPKIWTGTQFLPRFVRQDEVSGEGMCYFYDDGTHCKTSIDGEPVNAHWGVTKAGKPRKRLAIACITCREKKIKCDPDYPRCVQCDKFGRVCKFKNAPRGGQGFLENSSLPDTDDISQGPQRRDASEAGSSSRADKTPRNDSPRVTSHPSPELEMNSNKRRRHNDDISSVKSERSHIFHNTSPTHSQWASVTSQKTKDLVQMKWPNNPYDADPVLTKELVSVYFSNIASTAYSFLPETPFMEWLTGSTPKSSDDILLIYAILTVATIWSSNPRASKIGTDLAKTARFASAGAFGLQVVQARQHFALYFESIGSLERSWDFLGSAIRAAIGSNLHLELPAHSNLDVSTLPLGLNRGSYAETRRRTFWSCYIMDRLGSFRGSGRLSNISTENIFLRMPCDNASFKQQKELINPFFSPDLDLTYNESGTFGIMAYLVLVCTIYHDIMTKVWRAEQGQKIANVESFYQEMEDRLEKFIKSLPPCIAHSVDNINKTTEFGLLGSFAAVHAVYRAAMVKLSNSKVLDVPGLISSSERQRTATKQAEALVRETGQLSSRYNRSAGINDYACGHIPSFVGVAVTDAMRVLGGKALTATIKMEDAQEVVGNLCQIWPGILAPV